LSTANKCILTWPEPETRAHGHWHAPEALDGAVLRISGAPAKGLPTLMLCRVRLLLRTMSRAHL
jgi:hypothetical protein